MLKIRKCQWINHPRGFRILSSKAISFFSDGEHHFVWTTDTDESITLSVQAQTGIQCGIAIIFSIDQGLEIFRDGDDYRLRMDFLSVRTESVFHDCEEDLTVKKEGDSVLFFCGERLLHTFRFESINSSVSISFFSRGQGPVTFAFS